MALERPDLPVRDVSARLELAQGKLVADGIQAASGNSAIQSGRVELDFAAVQTRMSADAQWRADLDEALAFTRKQLAAGDRAKLDSLRALTGNAQGSVALSGTFDDLQVRAEAAQIRAQASIEPIPWPVNVTSAQVRADVAAHLASRPEYAALTEQVFNRPVSAEHWLKASNPMERWKWDTMFQDLPPVKGHNVQMEQMSQPTVIPLRLVTEEISRTSE